MLQNYIERIILNSVSTQTKRVLIKEGFLKLKIKIIFYVVKEVFP